MPPRKKVMKGKVSPRRLRSPTRRRRPARFEASREAVSRSPSPSLSPSPPPPAARESSSDYELAEPVHGPGLHPREGNRRRGSVFVPELQPQSDMSAILVAMQQELAETRREMREMRDNLQAVSGAGSTQPSAAAGSERDLASTPQAQASAAAGFPATASATPTNPAVTDSSNMQEALLSLMTAMEQPPNNSAGEELLSHHFTLGTTLSTRVKQRIVSGQYVDLTTMSTEKDSAPSLRFGSNEAPTLIYATKPKKIENIFDWINQFGMYAAVLLGAHPTLAPSMITYIVRIVQLHKRYGGNAWREYDIKFRQLKAAMPDSTCLPWHKVETALLLDTVGLATPAPAPAPNSGRNLPFRSQLARQSGSRAVGVCFNFNASRGCSRARCIFQHACSKCGGAHTQVDCSSKQTPPAKTASKPVQRSTDASRR